MSILLEQSGAKKRKGTGVLRRLRARTQSETIHLTQEDEWDTEVPNIRLSRVFAVVLILHVVAVGGMLAFQMLNPDETTADNANPTPVAPGSSGDSSPAAGLAETLPQQPRLGDPSVEGLRHYRVQSGDNLVKIARDRGVPIEELERLNGLDAGKKLYPGLILYLPNRQIKASQPEDVEALLADSRSTTIQPRNRPDAQGTAARTAEADPDVPRATPVLGKLSPTSQSPATGSRVAPSAPAPAAAANKPAAADDKRVLGMVKVYTVEKGDTAYGIGRKFGVSPDQLLKVNGVTDAAKLQIGQQLKIPVPN